MTSETELRARLHRLAERAGRPSADGRVLAGRIARDSADRSRRRRKLLAGVASVVLLGVAVPRLVGSGPEGAVPASGPVSAPARDVAGGAAATGGDAALFEAPTRGSLAGDQSFVDAVRALPWTPVPPPATPDGIPNHVPDPPLETRSVVFAGEVSGEHWALVIGRVSTLAPDMAGLPSGATAPRQPVAAWFAGPADAGPGGMVLRGGPGGFGPDWPLAITDTRTGALVVVGFPGDVVEVSPRPEIAADGSTSREWREVETVDGVAITRVPPFARAYDMSTSYRVFRAGRLVARDMPWSFTSDQTSPDVPVEYPRGRPSELGEQAAQSAAEHVLAEVGLSPAQVDITAQWVGSVPAGEPGQAAVVTVTLPSGAMVVEAQVLLPEQPGGGTMGGFCGQAVLPAGPPAERRVQALACEVVDYTTGAPMSTSLVVVGPPEVTLIRTYDEDRTFLTEHAAVDGVLVVPLPLGTETVEAVTAAGVTLGRVDVLGHTADFGD
ncbi:hypothetical protein [Blastococcus deserti]|uniref:Uncharacterized protein n=1 Tax=Blastococcus deserti TaxID=2259033 RepID=A0ABW4XJJ1_9ACTN